MFVKALTALSLLNNFPIFTANPSLVNQSNKPIFLLWCSTAINYLLLPKKYFNLLIQTHKKVMNSNLKTKPLLEPSNCQHFSFDLLFYYFWNVDDTTSTHGTLPRFGFAFIVPFMSALHTYPINHVPSPVDSWYHS